MGRVVRFEFFPVLCLIAFYKGLFALPTGDGGLGSFTPEEDLPGKGHR